MRVHDKYFVEFKSATGREKFTKWFEAAIRKSAKGAHMLYKDPDVTDRHCNGTGYVGGSFQFDPNMMLEAKAWPWHGL